MEPSIGTLAKLWLAQDKDEQTRAEIEALVKSNSNDELENRLRKRIAFGTAGLRSSMKAGFAHMNALTVLQASQGLADYILSQSGAGSGDGAPSIVIGFDARHNSEKFARLAAAAFLEKGLKVLWFGQLVHTPMVPFSVNKYEAAAGVMVTASHNPKNDNGYKVYWNNGSQIIPPHDSGIAAAIDNVSEVLTWDTTLVDNHSSVRNVFAEAAKSYVNQVTELVWPLPSVEQAMPFTYTAMHGVGLTWMKQIAFALWFRGPNMREVKEQAQPDPEFPTVPFPNPEEKGALDLAMKEANKNNTDIIIANDPDADRFSAAQRLSKGVYHQFTGNQLGILFASHVFETYTGDKSKLAMLASTVSSRMLSSMASAEGFHFQDTLTGFKWLGNVAQDLKKQGLDPAFAFEEAIGFMFPTVVWDKDGIAAAGVFLTAWQRWKKQGMSPWQKLQQLYQTYGYFEDANTYLISPSPDVTNRAFKDIRVSNKGSWPDKIGDRAILRWRDLTIGYDSGTKDHKPILPVDPTAQMITCELEHVVFTVRGSGTEPKIKLYIEAKASSSEAAKAEASAVLQDLLVEWFKPEYGLRLAGT
ncbi:related to Phosphoglucomutase-2 [Ramularia collo-cygni]|uniref:Related to Phosphoglucomutase-2 n=1 Tax=Ramularia collo-cygni TaxID=112498 RepID=A0A2D3ULT7_9PEZI|nr:related to Phosphoglucomutase-2 [Ramularia collo-cygni]CZT14261.1 related to Phosphoglucomutase-2 [Ramularia collo-cygni]